MKQVLLYLALFLLIGCSKPNEFIEIKNYWYPMDQVGKGKLFVYQNRQTKETSYTKFELIEEGKKEFLLDWQYSDSEKWDSSKWLIEGNRITMVETYWPSSRAGKYEMLPAEILHQEEVDGAEIREIKYRFADVRSTIKSVEKFVKDTVFIWKGQKFNCKVTQTQFDMTSVHPWVPFIKENSKSSNTKYYVRNIGLVKYFYYDPDEGRSEWDLIEIR
jgi:hypothetical protein